MRKISNFMAMVALVLIMAVSTVAFSAEKVIEAKLTQDAITNMDKNGNPYTRLIVNQKAKLQGVEYEIGVACMAFGDLSEKVANLKEGDVLKAIVSEREYQGRTSLTILKLL